MLELFCLLQITTTDYFRNDNFYITFWKLQISFTFTASFGPYHYPELFGGQIYFTDFKIAQSG